VLPQGKALGKRFAMMHQVVSERSGKKKEAAKQVLEVDRIYAFIRVCFPINGGYRELPTAWPAL
jgi:hypothetical protein